MTSRHYQEEVLLMTRLKVGTDIAEIMRMAIAQLVENPVCYET
jgi:hypothetical protein